MVKSPGVDQILGLYGFIDAFHHEIHDGDAYGCGVLFPTLADAGNGDLHIRTSNKYVHLTYDAACGGNAFGYFLEGVVVSTAGTSVDIPNIDRSSTNITGVTAFLSPTLSSTGTTVGAVFVPGGEKAFSSGGSAASREERILKKNMDYVIRINNRSGTATIASIRFSFYEHD